MNRGKQVHDPRQRCRPVVERDVSCPPSIAICFENGRKKIDYSRNFYVLSFVHIYQFHRALFRHETSPPRKTIFLHFLLTHSSLPATNVSTHPDNHLSTLPSLHPSPIVCLVWHFVCPSIVVYRHLERWITHPTVTEEAVIYAQVLWVGRVHDSKLFAFFDVAFCYKYELAACIVVTIPNDWVARVVEPGCGQKDAARGTSSESGI